MARFLKLRQILALIMARFELSSCEAQTASEFANKRSVSAVRREKPSENVPPCLTARQRHEVLIHALLSIEEGGLSSRLFIQFADSCPPKR